MSEITREDRILLRRAMRDYKKVKEAIKPLEKQKEAAHTIAKQIVEKYEKDFDYPEGRTDSRPFTRISYDYRKLDEMIESGMFDEDTKQLLLGCRQEYQSYSLWIL